MTELTQQALEAKREYQRQWREKNREDLRRYSNEYYQQNKDKKKEAMNRYWNKKADQQAAE